ncbi:hypothetical protein MMC20_004086 [Loxospora ochrophaea]|nr:hypothetical protein [Loxospora ochrophaea]
MSTNSSSSTTSAGLPPFNVRANPYRAQRRWPPDFSKMDLKHQFRLERRYRRRAKLKYARPGWTTAVKLAQWAGGLSVLGYGVLYIDWGQEKDDMPFQGIRQRYRDLVESLWTASTTQPTRPNLGKIGDASVKSSAAIAERNA